MIRLTFNTGWNRDVFAERFKLVDGKLGEKQLDIDWHLLQFAKLDPNCLDYDEVAVLTSTPGANAEQEFIVKGNPAVFGAHATVVQDMGGNFYLVKSTDGTTLGDYVDSIEHNSSGVKYLATDCYIDEMNTVPADVDPSTSDGQWARLRVISRYRPLATKFSTHELKFKSTPEIIIMDSGINFDHPEFNYPELQTEDFYTLPVFNGNYRDDVGHGTGVASCAVGKNLGVAQSVKLVNVKVGSSTHNATLLEIGSAIDAILNRIGANPTVTRVVNMSWGIARSEWLDSKVKSLLSAGVTVVCAAGNQGIDVADISPAGIPEVITVGSIDKYDIPSGFNNISPSDAGVTTGAGLSLDIFAPGENVVIAHYAGGYHLGSGTSFASPYVSGTAAAMASLYSGMMPYMNLKALIMDTATPDALLFEDERFNENQNKLIYYSVVDSNANAKDNNLLSYLGVLSDDNTSIIVNSKSILSVDTVFNIFEEPFTFKVKFLDPAQEAKYSPYVELHETGIIKITYPRFEMPEETKLVMVQFVVEADSASMKQVSPAIFFYDSNYKYKDTIESDVSLALTDTNSISFYGTWGSCK